MNQISHIIVQFFKNACFPNVSEIEINIFIFLGDYHFLNFEYQKNHSCKSILQF